MGAVYSRVDPCGQPCGTRPPPTLRDSAAVNLAGLGRRQPCGTRPPSTLRGPGALGARARARLYTMLRIVRGVVVGPYIVGLTLAVNLGGLGGSRHFANLAIFFASTCAHRAGSLYSCRSSKCQPQHFRKLCYPFVAGRRAMTRRSTG